MKSTINKIKQGQIDAELGGSGVDSIDTSVTNGTLTVTLNLSSGGSISDSTPVSLQGEYISSVNFTNGQLTATYSGTTESLDVNLDNRYLTSLPVHEHEEYEASSKVIIIDRDDLTTPNRTGVVEYLNNLGVEKLKGQTVYIHVMYIEKIIEIINLEQLFSQVTLEFQLNVESNMEIESTSTNQDVLTLNFNVG